MGALFDLKCGYDKILVYVCHADTEKCIFVWTILSQTPYHIPEILFDLHSGKKSEANPHILKDDFRKMQSRYKNYQQIYTDGSKEDSKVGCAVISDNHSNMQRIPDDSSIFTAEAKAIDLALDSISTCDANNKFIIFSDSLSVLKAMNHTS